MPYSVVVVDDSSFYRRRLTSLLEQHPDIEVIGQAADGEEAVKLARSLKPDVMTMDVEMPNMNGVAAVTKIMQSTPTAILMISSLTTEGALSTLQSIEAGAIDYIPKNFDDICDGRAKAIAFIQDKVIDLAKGFKRSQRKPARRTATDNSSDKLQDVKTRKSSLNSKVEAVPLVKNAQLPTGKQYKILMIGASTGGPQALQSVLNQFPQNFAHPILLVQHMPGTFTGAFATRLDKTAKITVKLAQDGDHLEPGHAYLAPGGYQMRLAGRGRFSRIVIEPSPDKKRYLFEPSVDFTLESVAKSFDGDALAVILTGMGNDGMLGAAALRKRGGSVWTQDESSCVVYGMPKSVFMSGNSDRVCPLGEVARDLLIEMTR